MGHQADPLGAGYMHSAREVNVDYQLRGEAGAHGHVCLYFPPEWQLQLLFSHQSLKS